MLLKSLELQGFKTFPEKTVLNFNKGITAVVGPNGSGKSNISDAIRWVLGEQAVKTIRCSKMEDVIFNGTTERKAKGFASVTLTISNADRKLSVDEDEVAITRRFYRSGESEYLINKNEVRLKDIHELFMDTGLGRDGYSMISQGKIDSIVASKNEERREIFEEAAGISKYRYRKAQAQRRLEQTEENLLRLYDIFKELEERISPLKEQADKAKIYVDLANEKKAVEIGTWLFTLNSSNEILQNYDSKIAVSRNQYSEVEKNLEDFNAKLDDLSRNILNRTVSVDEIRKKISDCEENAITKRGQISVLQNDILHNKESIERLSKEISNLEESFLTLESSASEKNEKINSLKELLAQNNLELRKNEEVFRSLTEKVNESTKKSEELSEELCKLKNLASEFQVKLITADSNIENLSQRKVVLEQSINSYEQKINSISEKLMTEKNSLNELKVQSENSDLELKSAKTNIKIFEENCEKLKQTTDKLTLDADAQLKKIHILEELERNLDGFAYSVKFLMKEAKNNTLSGIHGPISRLINVPSKFSVAIETALGAAVQNVVVDTEDSAKKAIFLLKNKGVGRATFLPISNIQGYELQEKALNLCQGFIGIASSLCDSEKVYRNILNFLLGRIVVVDNLDNAALIAKKFSYKFKIVTLDGQVINFGGALTGGSAGKNVGLLNRTEQINFLRKEYDRLNLDVKISKNSYDEMSNNLLELKKNFEMSIQNAQKIKFNLNDVAQKYQQKVLERDSLISICENFYKEKAEIFEKIKKLTAVANNSKEEFNTVGQKIEISEKSLLLVEESRSEFVAQREEINTKINDLRLKNVEVTGEIERSIFEVDSTLENKKLAEVQKTKLQKEIDDINLKNSEIEFRIINVNDEIENLKILSEQLNCNIMKLNSEKIEFEKNITELRNLERSTLNEKEKIALEIARLEDKKANVQKEYDTIIAKLWDEYELTRREAIANFKAIENTSQVIKKLNELRLKIKKLGVVNVAAIEEYNQVSERYQFMQTQINDVEKSKKELYRLINDLTRQMKTLFLDKFAQINENFGMVFKELFGGGKANLALTDTTDALNSGIEIYVQPPGKIVTHLEALSGGEHALIAIALYFAIMKVNPAPFCVLDEIEAALDDVNVDRFAAYLRKMNKNTQFIVISHRRGTMEEADVLYGVTMQNEGVSKLLELRATEIEKKFLS